MAGAVVSTRVSQEQYDKVNRLVANGIFGNRSKVLQTFIKLGLEYCDLDEHTVIAGISADFKARALTVMQEVALSNLVQFTIEELSGLIEMRYYKSIVDRLARVKDLSVQLSSSEYQQFMEMLEAESVYQVAQQIVRGEQSK